MSPYIGEVSKKQKEHQWLPNKNKNSDDNRY